VLKCREETAHSLTHSIAMLRLWYSLKLLFHHLISDKCTAGFHYNVDCIALCGRSYSISVLNFHSQQCINGNTWAIENW